MPEPITLQNDNLLAQIDHHKGSSLLFLHARANPRTPWKPLVARNVPGEDPSANPASFIMAPWCNRIAGASFTFNNKRINLKPDPRLGPQGPAMHGDVRKRPWTILDRSPVSARLAFDSRHHPDFNWPWPITMQCRYELDGPNLLQSIELTNQSNEPMPAGIGIHPYFPRNNHRPPAANPIKHTPFRAQAARRFPSVDCIPTAPARADALCTWLSNHNPTPPISTMDSFCDYQGITEVNWPDGTQLVLASDPSHQHLVYFAPTDQNRDPLPYIAIEPQTICANGMNMLAQNQPDHGVHILAPGQTLKTSHIFATYVPN